MTPPPVAVDTDVDLSRLEHSLTEKLAEEGGHLQEDLDLAADIEAPEELEGSAVRLAVAVAFPVLSAAAVLGGVFEGVGGRVYAALAGLLGIGLGVLLRRQLKPSVVMLGSAGGVLAIGLLCVLPSGVDKLFQLQSLVGQAASDGNVLRPPVPLDAGWQAVIGWIMGTLGFASFWLAAVVRRQSLAILLPLPLAGFAAISVPKDQQIGSGIAALLLFAVGLGVLSTAAETDDQGNPYPVSFQLRKTARALPFILLIGVAMFGLSKASFLFPQTVIDPTSQPQKPKTVPLSEVPDRELFKVTDTTLSGPWRIGALDVYDGKDWRLPPVAASTTKKVPSDGVVDSTLQPKVRATFNVTGLTGTTLPGLPNTVGVVAQGPRLVFDSRSKALKTAQGQVESGLTYTVAAAGPPNETQLRAAAPLLPDDVQQFAEIEGAPGAAVAALIAKAPSQNKWDQFNFLRSWVLDNVVADGAGTPVSITPERLDEIIGSKREASPFEIVAAQAMLARYVEVPSRIGYGYDGGQKLGDGISVRPKNGALFVEVYFNNSGWVPVIGTPKQAKAKLGDTSDKQSNTSVIPSKDIAVKLFLPFVTPGDSLVGKLIRLGLLLFAGAALVIGLVVLLWPVLRKSRRRSRLRDWARHQGPKSRIAVAYAELRDDATDFGYVFPADTPLAFTRRFVPDEEHYELAWLVTRSLWGDLRGEVTEHMALTVEQLTASMRSRLTSGQPATVRLVALVSRASLVDPFAPELGPQKPSRPSLFRRKETRSVAVPA